ncbi:MAG: adenylate/guanylate cyclase domain-containing protein, partial [Acidimicrobiales bacterium]
LRQAEVAGSEIVINAVSIMGGIDIVVPEGIEVVMQGISVMGGRNVRIADVPILPGSPIVRVRGLAVMGGISVRSKGPVPPPGAKGVGRRHTKDDARRDARQLARQARHDALDTAGRAVDDAMSRVDPSRRGRDRHDAPPARQARPGHSRQPPLPAGVDALMGTVAEQWRELRTRVAPEGTVTIMFSDIEGFTTIMERLGDHQASVLLKEHNDIIRGAVEKHRGFEVKNQGDGFMMAFDSASRALRCAIAIQQKLAEFNGDRSGEVIDVRIGMHTGEAIRDADDFFGNTVNVAARVAGEASGQEIVVSGLLKDLCAASGEFTFSGGDVVELRGLSQPQAIWSVRWE